MQSDSAGDRLELSVELPKTGREALRRRENWERCGGDHPQRRIVGQDERRGGGKDGVRSLGARQRAQEDGW